MQEQKPVIRIDPRDNVAIALSQLEPGDAARVQGGTDTVAVADAVPVSHKISLRPIRAGEDIVKYGEVIAQAREDIAPGKWVHNHNVG